MDYELLNLHLIQVRKALNKSKNNIYSDVEKHNYHNNLDELFKKINESVESKSAFRDDEIIRYQRQIVFIFKSLEFLDSSTLNLIPYEIVKCLQYAMEEWLGPEDKYIIVTSLVNNISGYSFDPSIAFDDDLFREFEIEYSIIFSHRLVQINLPRALSRDYLASVVLYHELGHFIDFRYAISETACKDVFFRLLTDSSTVRNYRGLFPYIDELISKLNSQEGEYLKYVFLNHMREYFADIFASQYIGYSSNHYLSYLTSRSSATLPTHPSTINRVTIVEQFLNNSDSLFINSLNEVVQKITSNGLGTRYSTPNSHEFLNFLPINVSSISEIHGLFMLGWNLWLKEWDESNAARGKLIQKKDVYNIINNLIEKTIGNHIISNQWSSHQT